MLNNQTIEKLRDLKLKVMANMLSNPDQSLKELSFEERLVDLICANTPSNKLSITFSLHKVSNSD